MEEIYPVNATYKEIYISASALRQYFFCNYLPFLRFTKFKKGIWVRDVPASLVRNAGVQSVRVERDGRIEEMSFLGAFVKSLSETGVFTIREFKLRAEVLPGIILLGAIDRLDVSNGRVSLTERKNTEREKPFDGEIIQIAAYALLLNRNCGIRFEDMDCSIEFLGKDKTTLKKFPVKIDEEVIEKVKKCLWELGSMVLGAKVPEPTKNGKKCAKCSVSGQCNLIIPML